MAPVATLWFEDVLGEVEDLHCLIGCFLGPDDALVGLQFTEIYSIRRTSRIMRQLSYYDVLWLREGICPVVFNDPNRWSG